MLVLKSSIIPSTCAREIHVRSWFIFLWHCLMSRSNAKYKGCLDRLYHGIAFLSVYHRIHHVTLLFSAFELKLLLRFLVTICFYSLFLLFVVYIITLIIQVWYFDLAEVLPICFEDFVELPCLWMLCNMLVFYYLFFIFMVE